MLGAVDLGTLANAVQILSGAIVPIIFIVGRYIWKKWDYQMKPNGGNSLRDSLDRTELAQQEIRKDLKKLTKVVKRLSESHESHLAEFK